MHSSSAKKKVEKVKVSAGVFAACLLFLVAFSALCQTSSAAIASELPETIDVRQMTFFEEMKTRNVEYLAAKQDWTLKVAPQDTQYLNSAEDTFYVEVYVSEVKDRLQTAVDVQTGKTEHIFRVYTASEEAIEQLKQIPNTHFYASMFTPSVGMTVLKQDLQQIASNPSVYCINVLPPMKFSGLTFDQARTQDDIYYTMSNHDTTLDASTSIAIIDSGYQASESVYGGYASDNIMPNSSWDFVDGDTDVSSGTNSHGSTVADVMVRAFGDSGTTVYSMYENRNFWIPLRVANDDSSGLVDRAPMAIEWCIAHDVDVVCMSFGVEVPPLFGINVCARWWCERFRTGTLGGTTWVAAAGNQGRSNGVTYPAESHFVVAIGAYDGTSPARESFSNYGSTYYFFYPQGFICQPCFNAHQLPTEFKPNAYECGDFIQVSGTSFAAPFACSDIAIGMCSPGGGEYNQGLEYLLDVVALCHEYPVSPDYASLQGDVIDTHTLWHRQAVTP